MVDVVRPTSSGQTRWGRWSFAGAGGRSCIKAQLSGRIHATGASPWSRMAHNPEPSKRATHCSKNSSRCMNRPLRGLCSPSSNGFHGLAPEANMRKSYPCLCSRCLRTHHDREVLISKMIPNGKVFVRQRRVSTQSPVRPGEDIGRIPEFHSALINFATPPADFLSPCG